MPHLIVILLGREIPLPRHSMRHILHILSLERSKIIEWWLEAWSWWFGALLLIDITRRLLCVALICNRCGNHPSSVYITPLFGVGRHRGGVLRVRPHRRYRLVPDRDVHLFYARSHYMVPQNELANIVVQF